MGIKGMTDRGASFPRIGELRKGGEKPATGNRPGQDLTFFRFTSKDRDVQQKFETEYGTSPAAVNCYLPYATAVENFEAWIEEWVAGGLKWRGDGETMVIWQKPDGTYSQEPKPQPEGRGKQVGRLKVIVPELGRLAYVVALTTSIHDIVEMAAVLEAYEALRGDLRGIPFILSRVPRMVSTPGEGGKRARREKWLWHLEAQPVWVQAQLSVMQRAALPTGAAQLESGAIADIETGEILDDDYEYEDTAETAQVVNEAPPANGNGNKPARPLSAVAVKEAMQKKTNGKGNKAPSEKQRKYAISSLAAVSTSDKHRHTITAYLFGKESTNDLTAAECSALIDWINYKEVAPDDWQADPDAIQESANIVRQDAVDKGQQELFPVVE